MTKAIFISLFALLIFAAHNCYKANQSLERCEAIVQQIHQHAENFKNI